MAADKFGGWKEEEEEEEEEEEKMSICWPTLLSEGVWVKTGMAIIVIILPSLLTYYFPKIFQATPHYPIWKSEVRIVMEWFGKL